MWWIVIDKWRINVSSELRQQSIRIDGNNNL